MKRTIALYAFILFSLLKLNCQELKRKRFYSSIAIERTFALNNLFNNKLYNNYFPKLDYFDISYRLDWRIYNNWGIWANCSMIISGKADKFPENFNLFNKIDLNNFYTTVERLENDDLRFRGMLGAFYKHETSKWIFTPYLGIGLEDFHVNHLHYKLKEKNSNNAYNINYRWSFDNSDQSEVLNFVYLQIKAEKKISKKFSLSLGLSYSHYIGCQEFTASMYDYYIGSLIKNIHEEGNSGDSLGVSLGIGF